LIYLTPSLQGWHFKNNNSRKRIMKNKPSNVVVWVDFKTGRKIDLSNFGHPQKPAQQIPYLYCSKNIQQKIARQK